MISYTHHLRFTAAEEKCLAVETQGGFEPSAEIVRHETVNERVDAAVAVS